MTPKKWAQKRFLAALILASLWFSCGSNKKQETQPDVDQTTPTKSSPGVTNELTIANTPREAIIDSVPSTSSADKPKGNIKEDHTKAKATPKTGCDLVFILLSNPEKNQHVYQVKNFNPQEFQCWASIENHGIQLCGETMPCTITYLEVSNITHTSNPPYNIDAATLKKHGIGRFEYKNSWWELKGAKQWERSGKGFDYYNTNRY